MPAAIGAMRSGTTSLFKSLCLHPSVTGPTLRKGVHFFDTGYRGGPDRYRSYFPLRATLRARPSPPTAAYSAMSAPNQNRATPRIASPPGEWRTNRSARPWTSASEPCKRT